MLTANIYINKLIDNIKVIKSRVKTSFCAVVKADAYGHGIVEISKIIEPYVDEYAVASLFEAYQLVMSGITKPINVLCNAQEEYAEKSKNLFAEIISNKLKFNNIIQSVATKDCIKIVKELKLKANIKVNSGMNRQGTKANEVNDIYDDLIDAKVDIHSIYSHFLLPENQTITELQFNEFSNIITDNRYKNLKKHICASSCLFLSPFYYFDMSRIGIAMYGYSKITQPIMDISTDIIQLIDVKKGDYVSYGGFTVDSDKRLAIIRAGYADGIRRKQLPWDKRFVSINNNLCSVVGQVCMDMCMVDVTDLQVNVKDRVYILGEKVDCDFLSRNYNTINYEVLTGFSRPRIKRNYIG